MPGHRASHGANQLPLRVSGDTSGGARDESPVDTAAEGLLWSRVPRGWRWTTYIAIAVLLALGFWAYQSPAMRINWETVAALCGF